MIPCYAPVIAPSEVFAAPLENITLGGARPATLCGYRFETPTPNVIALESLKFTESTIEIHVKALAPGEGIVTVTSQAVGGGTYTIPVSKIHVDSCVHSLKLPPSYGVASPALVHIEPEITGLFQRGYVWYVNGVAASTGPTFDFLPPGYGTFTITVHAESETCGSEDATTVVVVAAARNRAVRRR